MDMVKKEFSLGEFIIHQIINVILCLAGSLVVAGIILLLSNVFSINWIYKDIFWALFIWGSLFFIALAIIIETAPRHWYRVFSKHCNMGKTYRASFEAACKEVKSKLPKWLLKKHVIKYNEDAKRDLQ